MSLNRTSTWLTSSMSSSLVGLSLLNLLNVELCEQSSTNETPSSLHLIFPFTLSLKSRESTQPLVPKADETRQSGARSLRPRPPAPFLSQPWRKPTRTSHTPECFKDLLAPSSCRSVRFLLWHRLTASSIGPIIAQRPLRLSARPVSIVTAPFTSPPPF